jgi:glycosyltransferase involved in cell wall biosynthesis
MSLATIEPEQRSASDAPVARDARIALFHQNDVFAMQGGIERYVSTLYQAAPERVVLVCPPISQASNRHFAVGAGAVRNAPQGLRFLVGLFMQRRAIGAFLRQHDVTVMEFSRPEYILAAVLFPGKRVVTIHGTGPGPGHRLHYLLHHACCLLLPLLADRVQIIGRDPSGVPGLARRLLGARVAYVDAWCDDSFTPAALPPLADGDRLRVFYAGRIAPQKNPRLLFEIIREAARQAPDALEFHYFGSDFEAFAQAGLGAQVENHGFLGPQALAEAIRSCHLGLMCSAFGEGSPYILIEALACGRPFVVPTLPTLVSAYQGFGGVHFVERYQAEDYVAAIAAVRAAIRASEVDPMTISVQTAARSKSRAAPALLDALARRDG